jgi:PIN domain nuclease of toxin-antitoxin system
MELEPWPVLSLARSTETSFVSTIARLSRVAIEAIDDEANERFLSDVTLWKISLKHAIGKLPLPEPPRDWISDRFSHTHPRQCRIAPHN